MRTEHPAHRRSDAQAAGFADAADRHARMARLDDHRHPLGFQFAHEQVGDRFGHTLLDLRTAGHDLDHAGQLAQPDHLAVGQVADVRLPMNGSMWCSHILLKLMSLTSTTSSYFSLKNFFKCCRGSSCNPLNISAYIRATRPGVSSSPSRSGSSPIAAKISRTARSIRG